PNPFGERAEVAFALPSAERVRLAVYDVLGREVARLVDGEREAGTHRVAFEASALPAGVYVVRLVAGTTTAAPRVTGLRWPEERFQTCSHETHSGNGHESVAFPRARPPRRAGGAGAGPSGVPRPPRRLGAARGGGGVHRRRVPPGELPPPAPRWRR